MQQVILLRVSSGVGANLHTQAENAKQKRKKLFVQELQPKQKAFHLVKLGALWNIDEHERDTPDAE